MNLIWRKLPKKYRKQRFDVLSYMILTVFINQRIQWRKDKTSYEISDRFLGFTKQDFGELLKNLEKLYDGSEHKRRRFDFH